MRLAPLAAVATLALAIGASPSAASPSCLTPVAPHEPPCNPYAASDWAINHRNAYEQDSTPYAGPRSTSDVRLQHVSLGQDQGTLPFLQFSAPYSDGGRVAWYSEVTQPDSTLIGKLDVRTGEPIDLYRRQGTSLASASGAYSLLDSGGRFIVGKGDALTAYADATPGVPTSKIALVRTLHLPASALCGSGDRLVGIVLTWSGDIAFATANGVVGVVPDDPTRWTQATVRTASTNSPAACASGSGLETVSNSIAVDEKGGIYVVTSGAQYRFRWNGSQVRETWRVPYRSDGYQGGVRLGVGSGSSPTLMGTAKRDDKLVVITDGQKVMHLLFMWRDHVPKGWKPIAPGANPRIACDVPVDFGDPQIDNAQSEQSVAVRGYGAVVVNNSLKNSAAFDSLPGSLHYTAAVLASGTPLIAAHGMERVDWDPATRSCHVAWTNSTVSIPNAIPTISGGSDMVYAVGQRNGSWGLEGVDYGTGASRLWVPAGLSPSDNSVYADSEVAPDGSVWSGTWGSADIYRNVNPNPPLPMACVDPRHTGCTAARRRADRHRRRAH
jgi:hypothetical protein